jgi:Spy/CpxP family protein refolding chaperone
MIKTMLIAIALLVSGTAANAQKSDVAPAAKSTNAKRQLGPEDRAVRVLRMMTSQVGLSDAQTAEVKQILLTRENVRASARNEDGSLNPAKKDEVKAANQKANEQLKEILTPEQWQKWEAYKQELKKRREEKKAEPGKGAPSGPEIKKAPDFQGLFL